jgi:uncharacterized protein (TIGR02118 family)
VHVLAVLASRPPEWNRERFTSWWRGPHAAKARCLPGLLEYTHGVVEEDVDGRGEQWDGFARLAFASRASLDAALSSAEWNDAVADAVGLGGRRIALICDEADLLARDV